jgi:hypothetical protein
MELMHTSDEEVSCCSRVTWPVLVKNAMASAWAESGSGKLVSDQFWR